MHGAQPPRDLFTRHHLSRVALHLVTLRWELQTAGRLMNGSPNEIQVRATDYKRKLRKHEASNVTPLDGTKNPWDDNLDYARLRMNFKLLQTESPQMDSNIAIAVQEFVGELSHDEANQLFDVNPTEQHQYKIVMSLVIHPERNKFLDLSEFLDRSEFEIPPSPQDHPQWVKIACAYERSTTAYSDAIEAALSVETGRGL